jgi:hypothetical protein
MEIPLNLIIGVTIVDTGDAETISYYPQLILDRIYWRIRLDADGSSDSAVKIAKTVANFLNVNYFATESAAPLTIWNQKFLAGAAPYQFEWQY